MRFEGKFINEKGKKVNWWFNAPDENKLREHLDSKGWKILDLKVAKKRFVGKFKNEKHEIVDYWFETDSEETFESHLKTIGWEIINLKEPYLLESQKQQLKIVPSNKRFLNCIIDSACLLSIQYAIGFAIGLGFMSMGIKVSQVPSFDQVYKILVGYPVAFLFYFAFEIAFNKTPGKYFTKTKVVTKQGKNPSIQNIAMRSLVRLVPFEPFSFVGNSWGWHDTVAETCVVIDK